MTAPDLLSELHRRGVRLRLVDDRLDVRAATGALTPQLREELREHRDALVALLRRMTDSGSPPEIVPRPEQRYEPFPLTDIQHAYWVGRNPALQLGGVATHYYFELDGLDLDPGRLAASLRKVIDRHDMLRAVVDPDGRQRILAEVPPYDLPVADLRAVQDDERRAALAKTRAEMGHQLLPPEHWPLFDLRASLVDEHRIRLHISINVLIMDAFSLQLLFRDWRRCYTEPDRTPEPLALSYRDYVLAEEAARDGREYRAAEAYWRDRLDSLPPAPALPLRAGAAAGGPGAAPVEFVRRSARLPRPLWDALKRTAQRYGVTPSVAVMSAYAEILRAWSRQADFTLNLSLFNRRPLHPQIGDVIGDFTSVTLLAATAEPGESFADRARRLNRRLVQDLEHSAFSGVRVLRERSRRLGGGPGAAMPVVFTSALALGDRENRTPDSRFFGEFGYGISQTPQVWLDHQVTEESGDLCLDWDAVEALFPAGLLDDMFDSYQALLRRLAGDETGWDAVDAPVPLPAHQLEQRRRVNDTVADLPARTLCELVEARAAGQPEAVAVIAPDGELSHGEVVDRARRLAVRLRDLGAGTGELVAVVTDRCAAQVPAVLGVVRAGAAYLPIEPAWPAARRADLIEQGRVRIVVTTPRLRDELDWPAGLRLVTLDDPEVRAADPAGVGPGPAPDDLAYVIFTSGSTGRPKGVMIDHRGAANTVQDVNARFGITPADRVLALSALSFDLSVYDVFGALAAGAAVVLPAPGRAADPEHWSDLVRRHRVSVWNSVPALMQAWADAPAAFADPADSPLRVVLLSGDWIPVRLPDAVRARHAKAAVHSLGGATEASIWSVHHPIEVVGTDWTSIPYGRPMANQTMHVYDAGLAPCPVWTPGELYIGGVGVALGYWADPVRTDERFVRHPVTGERLYRTGDLGRHLPDGTIEFLGRDDDQVKLNGFRIELGEITATLSRQPGVAEAVTVVDTNPGTGRRQLVGYVVPADPATPPPAETLRAGLARVLPDYMVPHHYPVLDRIPLSANGKVDRAALPSPWESLLPAGHRPPADEVERTVHEIWRETLGRDDFGVADNFFELGADSLHAVRILGRLREEFGIEPDADEGLPMLFDSPTVAELAETVRSLLRERP
ncbi:non-ribosomal peptide synthetase [Micromonospora narathiwatensis]|uniref:Phenyloxazoline synthase MbtB n=1 Tax=Micromonospora narathiwatensis TaxID=299146 RepID=A0A1A8ZHP2_9ACTN|nr:non-ribosomal peptide synthetase [Micromonospora narathiwatensis]SBT43396.1 amino acid adenylation domain-containing protein [Micromonospora narathiwatensis]